MKKSMLGAVACLLLMLSGCSNREAFPVEALDWQLCTVQEQETGEVLFAGPGEDGWPEAEEKALSCVMEAGEITLTDEAKGENWRGTYRQIQAPDHQGTAVYEVAFEDDGEGLLTTGVTRYQNGEEEASLLLDTGDYVLRFSAPLSNESP